MNQRSFLMGLALVCLLVAIGAVAYGAGRTTAVEEIRTQRLVIVDEEGKESIVLRPGDLRLLSESGKPGVILGPGMLLVSGKKTDDPGASVLVAADEQEPYVCLYDPALQERVVLRSFKDGDAGIAVNAGGAGLVVGASKSNHQCYVTLNDDKHSTRVMLSSRAEKGAEGDSDALLVLYDEDEDPIWSAP